MDNTSNNTSPNNTSPNDLRKKFYGNERWSKEIEKLHKNPNASLSKLDLFEGIRLAIEQTCENKGIQTTKT